MWLRLQPMGGICIISTHSLLAKLCYFSIFRNSITLKYNLPMLQNVELRWLMVGVTSRALYFIFISFMAKNLQMYKIPNNLLIWESIYRCCKWCARMPLSFIWSKVSISKWRVLYSWCILYICHHLKGYLWSCIKHVSFNIHRD